MNIEHTVRLLESEIIRRRGNETVSNIWLKVCKISSLLYSSRSLKINQRLAFIGKNIGSYLHLIINWYFTLGSFICLIYKHNLNNKMKMKSFLIIFLTISLSVLWGLETPEDVLAANTGTRFYAKLAGDSELPPVNSTASGIVSFYVNGDVIFYKIRASGINSAGAALLHDAEAGSKGDAVATLVSTKNSNTDSQEILKEGIISSAITSTDLTGPLEGKSIGDLVSLMQSGRIYVNVNSSDYPDGEIRGQVGQ